MCARVRIWLLFILCDRQINDAPEVFFSPVHNVIINARILAHVDFVSIYAVIASGNAMQMHIVHDVQTVYVTVIFVQYDFHYLILICSQQT